MYLPGHHNIFTLLYTSTSEYAALGVPTPPAPVVIAWCSLILANHTVFFGISVLFSRYCYDQFYYIYSSELF